MVRFRATTRVSRFEAVRDAGAATCGSAERLPGGNAPPGAAGRRRRSRRATATVLARRAGPPPRRGEPLSPKLYAVAAPCGRSGTSARS